MDEGTIALIITSGGIFAVFVGLFIWGLVSGQFRNVEEPKYRIFEAEDARDEKKGEGNNG
ncbi:MAG: cbb3-type cytochrome oxidase assembly protein [Clostridiales bacterium]|nr:cbb3-type cytochrome oxidase assembly protein [Clostridiales bacterium]